MGGGGGNRWVMVVIGCGWLMVVVVGGSLCVVVVVGVGRHRWRVGCRLVVAVGWYWWVLVVGRRW